jgi:hypothetical protein
MKKSILAIALLATLPAHAFDIELGTGAAHYKTAHDGLWYQAQYRNDLDLKTTPWSVGISEQYGSLRYRAQIISLGSVYTAGVWASDADYYPGSPSKPLYIGNGKGSASGLIFSLSKPAPFFDLPLYVEAGAFIYVPSWVQKIRDYNSREYLYDLEAEKNVRIGPVLGIGIRKHSLDISIKYIGMQYNGTEPFPPIWDRAYVLETKVYF